MVGGDASLWLVLFRVITPRLTAVAKTNVAKISFLFFKKRDIKKFLPIQKLVNPLKQNRG